MTIEDYLSKERGVNPNEKIDTNDDGYWKLKDLIAGYIEEEELVKNLTIPIVSVNEERMAVCYLEGCADQLNGKCHHTAEKYKRCRSKQTVL